MSRSSVPTTLVALVVSLAAAPAWADATACLAASGDASFTCLKQYTRLVGACRTKPSAICEAALRADGGQVVESGTEQQQRLGCVG